MIYTFRKFKKDLKKSRVEIIFGALAVIVLNFFARGHAFIAILAAAAFFCTWAYFTGRIPIGMWQRLMRMVKYPDGNPVYKSA